MTAQPTAWPSAGSATGSFDRGSMGVNEIRDLSVSFFCKLTSDLWYRSDYDLGTPANIYA